MFTGIIQKTGRIVELQRRGGSGRVLVESSAWDSPLVLGESIAVNGCCLTVAAMDGSRMRFDVLEETFARTCLGEKRSGQRVNLERALKAGDALGGHFVTGHVDGTGRVREVRQIGRDISVSIHPPRELLSGMVPKGSIALDGISLTIVELAPDFFSVHIIPHTIAETAIGELKSGDAVNLETDMIGKYVQRFLQSAPASGGLTWDKLRDAGFVGG
jgi:riboflavin synthase